LISPARPIWPRGWLSTLAEIRVVSGLQAVKGLAANGVLASAAETISSGAIPNWLQEERALLFILPPGKLCADGNVWRSQI
jgi:hypothetical protein